MKNKTNNGKSSGVKGEMKEGKEEMKEWLEDMKKSTREKMAQMKGKAHEFRGGVDSYIEKNPEKSVLIAAGVGMVAGVIIASAFMRRRH